jgi:uncharacterized protein (DUF58 family)
VGAVGAPGAVGASGASGPAVRLRRDRWLRPPRTLRATRAGWCFIAIIFGVGFAALNTGNNLLYLVLALMLSFLVLSGLLSESSLRGIQINRSLPRELFAGTPNRVVLKVRNTLRRKPSFAITIEDQIQIDEQIESAGRVFALRIGPKSSAERSYPFEPKHRGEIRFSGLRVSTRFPFGLFVKSRQLDLPEIGLVYPQISPVALKTGSASDLAEHEEEASTSRDGDEISGLREFVAGDSQRRIHWRSSLRAGRLLVGEREGIAATRIDVELDLPPSAVSSLIEERVAHAASQVVAHLDAGLHVGLRTAAVYFRAASGHGHRSDLLRFLARVKPKSRLESRS